MYFVITLAWTEKRGKSRVVTTYMHIQKATVQFTASAVLPRIKFY
jgi:hypothetical protein